MRIILGVSFPDPEIFVCIIFPSTHTLKKFEWNSDELRKCLKGKSCFHIKKLTDSLEKELASMIKRGIELYQMDKLI
jgi:hypothetical protein